MSVCTSERPDMLSDLASQSGATSQVPRGKKNPISVLHEFFQVKNQEIEWKIQPEDSRFKAWPVIDGKEYQLGYAKNKQDAKKNSAYLTLKHLESELPMDFLQKVEVPSLLQEPSSEYVEKEIPDEEVMRYRNDIDEQIMRASLLDVNPIYQLNEICSKNGLQPDFRTSMEGPDNLKIFKMELLINDDLIAKSHGKSKKEAKNTLCSRALHELSKRNLISEGELGTYRVTPESQSINVQSNLKNSVSAFNEFSQQLQQNPSFEEYSKGTPNVKRFYARAILNERLFGIQSSMNKKKAKTNAAYVALRTLAQEKKFCELDLVQVPEGLCRHEVVEYSNHANIDIGSDDDSSKFRTSDESSSSNEKEEVKSPADKSPSSMKTKTDSFLQKAQMLNISCISSSNDKADEKNPKEILIDDMKISSNSLGWYGLKFPYMAEYKLTLENVEKIFSEFGTVAKTYTPDTQEAFVYFKNATDVENVFKKMGKSYKLKPLSADEDIYMKKSFKDCLLDIKKDTDRTVLLENLPCSYSEKNIRSMFSSYKLSEIILPKGQRRGKLIMSDTEEAKKLYHEMKNHFEFRIELALNDSKEDPEDDSDDLWEDEESPLNKKQLKDESPELNDEKSLTMDSKSFTFAKYAQSSGEINKEFSSNNENNYCSSYDHRIQSDKENPAPINVKENPQPISDNANPEPISDKHLHSSAHYEYKDSGIDNEEKNNISPFEFKDYIEYKVNSLPVGMNVYVDRCGEFDTSPSLSKYQVINDNIVDDNMSQDDEMSICSDMTQVKHKNEKYLQSIEKEMLEIDDKVNRLQRKIKKYQDRKRTLISFYHELTGPKRNHELTGPMRNHELSGPMRNNELTGLSLKSSETIICDDSHLTDELFSFEVLKSVPAVETNSIPNDNIPSYIFEFASFQNLTNVAQRVAQCPAISITHVDEKNPGIFWGHILDEEGQRHIKRVLEEANDMNRRHFPHDVCKENDKKCFAFYNGEIWRGRKYQDMDNEDYVHVFFVDFGNYETIRANECIIFRDDAYCEKMWDEVPQCIPFRFIGEIPFDLELTDFVNKNVRVTTNNELIEDTILTITQLDL